MTMRTYTVRQGETLAMIAEKVYGNAQYATYLYNANRDRIDNPNQLFALQLIVIPRLTTDMAIEAVKREIFNG